MNKFEKMNKLNSFKGLFWIQIIYLNRFLKIFLFRACVKQTVFLHSYYCALFLPIIPFQDKMNLFVLYFFHRDISSANCDLVLCLLSEC